MCLNNSEQILCDFLSIIASRAEHDGKLVDP